MVNYLIEKLFENTERFQNRAFYTFKRPGHQNWEIATWSEFLADCRKAGRALYALGMNELDKGILCGPNIPNLLIAEYAGFINRMAGVPIYAYSSEAQFNYIANDCKARIAFVGAKEQYKLAEAYNKSAESPLEYIILADENVDFDEINDDRVLTWSEFMAKGDMSLKEELLERVMRGKPNDMASLIYTSGTTGEPKGVIILHSQYEAQLNEHLRRLTDINENELSLSFLPMSHIFEKAWLFFCIVKGVRVAFNYDPRDVETSLREIRPNLMCCVPRFWEKVYTGVINHIQQMNWWQKLCVKRALKIGSLVNLKYKCKNKKIPSRLMREYRMWDRHLFSKVRNRIGLPEPNIFPTAGAVLAPKICAFMRSIGIDIIIGYGMTETTATITCFPKFNFEIGTVGTPMSEIQIKIDNSGEILVKGPTVTPGYYHNDQANADAFTEDGWMRTGDSGYFDEEGALILSSRKKDLFKTSGGKYIAPQNIESVVATSLYIDEIAVIGERRKYVTALVVPNFDNVEKWAQTKGLHFESAEQMCESQEVQAFILNEIHKLQSDMADFERIKRVTLLPHHFSVQNGELTNTLKKRRDIIEKKYKKQIQSMYPDELLGIDPIQDKKI